MRYSFTAVRRSRRVRNGHFVANNKIDLESEIAWIIHETGADKLTTLSAALEKRLARKVKLNCKVDASIMSGLVIKAGDMVIDGSVRNQLNRLATIMQS